MHKNVQFQVRVRPGFIGLVTKAAEQKGLQRWEYLNEVVNEILGGDADWAYPESPPNRKGIRIDYWNAYQRIPFILTVKGMAALGREKNKQGFRTLSAFLRHHLSNRVADDLGMHAARIEQPQPKVKGSGF